MTIERITVPREARGVRLDKFLPTARPGLSLDRTRELASGGNLRIREKRCQASQLLWGGETIDIHWPEPVRRAPVAGPDLPLLYEDADVVVVNKPAGLVVEPNAHHPSVVGCLASTLKGLDVNGRAEPGVVHRLDRETSGCLALAKHDRAVAALKAAFDAKQIEKRYTALVLGEPPESRRIETPYGRDAKDQRRFTTRYASPRRAALSFVVQERFREGALLDVTLETGRTHQIRVQLADAGYPVLADDVYGPQPVRTHPVAVALGRHALHSRRISLPQPTSGERVGVEAPWPADFAAAIEAMRAR